MMHLMYCWCFCQDCDLFILWIKIRITEDIIGNYNFDFLYTMYIHLLLIHPSIFSHFCVQIISFSLWGIGPSNLVSWFILGEVVFRSYCGLRLESYGYTCSNLVWIMSFTLWGVGPSNLVLVSSGKGGVSWTKSRSLTVASFSNFMVIHTHVPVQILSWSHLADSCTSWGPGLLNLVTWCIVGGRCVVTQKYVAAVSFWKCNWQLVISNMQIDMHPVHLATDEYVV